MVKDRIHKKQLETAENIGHMPFVQSFVRTAERDN